MFTNDFTPTAPNAVIITGLALVVIGFGAFLFTAFRENHPGPHDGRIAAAGIALMLFGWAALVVYVASGIRL